MMKKISNKKAFSLIELSVVILIIGVIVAGVTQSSRMVSTFRLSTARNLTQSSPIASMKNVTLWYETTSSASFTESQADNGLTVTTWYDINPTSTIKYNTTGGPGATYTTNCVNSLPCLRFGGSSSYYFTYDGTFLVGTDYTVIMVEQRRSSASNNYFMGGSGAWTNLSLILGYRANTTLTFAQYLNDYDITIAAYSSPTPRIHVYRYSSSTGKTHYLNGALSTFTGSASGTTGLSSNSGATIGSYPATPSYYNGDICEVIMFNRAITTEERDAIETYLGKKWGITVS